MIQSHDLNYDKLINSFFEEGKTTLSLRRKQKMQYFGGEKGIEIIINTVELLTKRFQSFYFLTLISSISISLDKIKKLFPDYEISEIRSIKLDFEKLSVISITKRVS